MKFNKIYFHTSEKMKEVPNETARLVLASPPFTNNSDGKSLDKEDYLNFLKTVYSEANRILVPGGVLVSLNTDLKDHSKYNKGNTSYEGKVWLKHAEINKISEELGFKQFDYKIWVKSLKQNPYRFNFSHLLFFEKSGEKRFKHHSQKHTENFGESVWYLKDSMQRLDSNGFKFLDAIHPEISRRCIREFTKEGDLIVSPFVGSGTFVSTAQELNRKWIGYEINKNLETLIKESVYGPRPKIYNE